MKKLISLLIAALLPSLAFAQFKVSADGNAGTPNYSDEAQLYVSSDDTEIIPLLVESPYSGISVKCLSGGNYTTTSKGIGVSCSNASSNSYGLYILSSNFYQNTSGGRSHGVFSSVVGSNAVCYGVTGRLYSSSTKGSAILGLAYGNNAPSITGQYAGYFCGNVKSTGIITGTITSDSDERLKEDMQVIADSEKGEDGCVISKLELLTPISYRYKAMKNGEESSELDDNDETSFGREGNESKTEPNQVMKKRHFGFVAQELQQVYPDLVYEQEDGYLSVNYVELVPILVEAIKELNAKVEELSGNNYARKAKSSEIADVDDVNHPTQESNGVASMDQNMPNPFTEKTDIAIYLPESVKSAILYIYDLSGKQLEQHPIMGRGETVMTIHADKRAAGMYVYSLIADGKVVTTKKMIVVK